MASFVNSRHLSYKMFHFIKGPQRLVHVSNILINKGQQLVNTVRPFRLFFNDSVQNRLCIAMQNGVLGSNVTDQSRLYISRNRHKSTIARRRKNLDDDRSDDEDELEDEDDDEVDKNVKTYKLQSMRIDLVLKTFLRISRKSIENFFYENKIRINGQVALKKSQTAKEGDEIDIIIGVDNNSDCINIKRVVIYEAEYEEDSDKFHVKGKCFKSLKVKNYSGGAVWREAEEQN